MEETPKKYTQPTDTKNNLRPKARWKDDTENERKDMATVNWRQVVQDRD